MEQLARLMIDQIFPQEQSEEIDCFSRALDGLVECSQYWQCDVSKMPLEGE
jgi:hypothetical protein